MAVQMVPNGAGNLFIPFVDKATGEVKMSKDGKSRRGYIRVVELSRKRFGNKQLRRANYAFITGSEDVLNDIIKEAKDKYIIPGRIVIIEETIDNLADPEHILRREFIGSEDYIQEHGLRNICEQRNMFKRAGKDGPILKVDGFEIVSFRVWDEHCEMENVTVEHTNRDEVAAFKNAQINGDIKPNQKPETTKTKVKDPA